MDSPAHPNLSKLSTILSELQGNPLTDLSKSKLLSTAVLQHQTHLDLAEAALSREDLPVFNLHVNICHTILAVLQTYDALPTLPRNPGVPAPDVP